MTKAKPAKTHKHPGKPPHDDREDPEPTVSTVNPTPTGGIRPPANHGDKPKPRAV